MIHYVALIHKASDSGYGVSFLDVPSVIVASDTLDEALHEAGIALGFVFADWQGERPARRSLDDLREDPEFLELSADAVIAAVAPAGGMAQAV